MIILFAKVMYGQKYYLVDSLTVRLNDRHPQKGTPSYLHAYALAGGILYLCFGGLCNKCLETPYIAVYAVGAERHELYGN